MKEKNHRPQSITVRDLLFCLLPGVEECRAWGYHLRNLTPIASLNSEATFAFFSITCGSSTRKDIFYGNLVHKYITLGHCITLCQHFLVHEEEKYAEPTSWWIFRECLSLCEGKSVVDMPFCLFYLLRAQHKNGYPSHVQAQSFMRKEENPLALLVFPKRFKKDLRFHGRPGSARSVPSHFQ